MVAVVVVEVVVVVSMGAPLGSIGNSAVGGNVSCGINGLRIMVGSRVEGVDDGVRVGSEEGGLVGLADGEEVGLGVGSLVGALIGFNDGDPVGPAVNVLHSSSYGQVEVPNTTLQHSSKVL